MLFCQKGHCSYAAFLMNTSIETFKDLYTGVHQSMTNPESADRVPLNRLFELHGPQLAMCWAFRRHVEMSLTCFCLFIFVYKFVIVFVIAEIGEGFSQEGAIFWNEVVVGAMACSIWAPATLHQWKWVEATLLLEWNVSDSLLTNSRSAFYRKHVVMNSSTSAKQQSKTSICPSKHRDPHRQDTHRAHHLEEDEGGDEKYIDERRKLLQVRSHGLQLQSLWRTPTAAVG